MQLYNKLSAEERAQIIDKNSQERITLSFYKYFNIGNPLLFRDHIFIKWSKMDEYMLPRKELMPNYLFQKKALIDLKNQSQK
jgi:hypothetical protein